MRLYENRYYHYTEDDNYPRRIRKPITLFLFIVLMAMFLVALKLIS